MIVYAYYDDDAPHGRRAFTSERKAKQRRAKDFTRAIRPELYRYHIKEPITAQVVCALITGSDFTTLIEDIK